MHDLPRSAGGRDTSSRADLAQRLRQSARPDRGELEEIVRTVVTTMRGDLTVQETSLLTEVEELGRTIAAAKAEIAALQVDDITDSHIPSATDELGAIVDHTAAATNAILEVCETLDLLAGQVSPSQSEQLNDATTRIYEACSFQDITGQRISKVVVTLKTIETKVAQILSTFRQPDDMVPMAVPTAAAEDGLLNGPQLPTEAMGQSDIDRLLASFE